MKFKLFCIAFLSVGSSFALVAPNHQSGKATKKVLHYEFIAETGNVALLNECIHVLAQHHIAASISPFVSTGQMLWVAPSSDARRARAILLQYPAFRRRGIILYKHAKRRP